MDVARPGRLLAALRWCATRAGALDDLAQSFRKELPDPDDAPAQAEAATDLLAAVLFVISAALLRVLDVRDPQAHCRLCTPARLDLLAGSLRDLRSLAVHVQDVRA